MQFFINNYVLTSQSENSISLEEGKSVTKTYSVEKNLYSKGKYDIDIIRTSTVMEVLAKGVINFGSYSSTVSRVHYPSIVQLQHNGENNGKLIAIFCLSDTGFSANAPNTNACVMESSDDGKTWQVIARPVESFDKSIKGLSMAHIYELPAPLGDLPEGTLIYSGNSVNYDRKSHITTFVSTDCGYTWEQTSMI